MPAANAHWFDGKCAEARPVTVSAEGDLLRVQSGSQTAFTVPIATLQWRWAAADPRPTVALSEGGQLTFDSRTASVALGVTGGDDGLVDRAARSTPIAVAAVGLMLFILVAALTWLVPRSAAIAASNLPWRAERVLGGEVVRALGSAYLAPTELSVGERQRVRARFETLAQQAGLSGTQFILAKGKGLGANAAALPGRLIVVTDELIEALGESDQLDAVVAHELGHLQHRHALQALIREAGLSVVLGTVVQDQGLQKVLADAAPKALLQAAHSRDAERQADEFAVGLLRKTGRSGADLALALEKLQSLRSAQDQRDFYLRSHPATSERIDAARAQR